MTGRSTTELLQDRLQEPLMRGELYATALHAIGVQHVDLHRACIALVQAVPTLRTPYASALEWAGPQAAWWALNQWGKTPNGPQSDGGSLAVAMALIAASAHPHVSSQLGNTPWWQQIMQGEEPSGEGRNAFEIALMHFALASGHPHATAQAPALLQSPVALVRCVSAEVVLGQGPHQQRSEAIKHARDTLLTLATTTNLAFKEVISQATFVLACRDHAGFDAALGTLKAQPQQLGLYLQALGWSGRIQAVPDLMAHLDHPEHARAAGASLSMLTGSLPARDGWQAPPQVPAKTVANTVAERDNVTIPAAQPYADLALPDQAGFARWWSNNKQNFSAKAIWLAGLPETDVNLVAVLRRGKLAWRNAATRRLQALQGGPGLNTGAPSIQQCQWLAKHATSPTKKHTA